MLLLLPLHPCWVVTITKKSIRVASYHLVQTNTSIIQTDLNLILKYFRFFLGNFTFWFVCVFQRAEMYHSIISFAMI